MKQTVLSMEKSIAVEHQCHPDIPALPRHIRKVLEICIGYRTETNAMVAQWETTHMVRGKFISAPEVSSPYSARRSNAAGALPHHPYLRKNSQACCRRFPYMMGRKHLFTHQLALSLDEAAVFGPSTLRTRKNQPTGQKLHLATLRIH